jgi:hypothetical protein
MKTEERIGGLMTAIIVAVVAFNFLTVGCFPLITGIKEYKGSDGSVIKFVTGADITVGANGTDTVDNKRGIKPD